MHDGILPEAIGDGDSVLPKSYVDFSFTFLHIHAQSNKLK